MRKAKVWDARQLPAYLTVVQYGELMGICPKTVRRMCQRGELPAHKEGPRLWRIDKNAALEQRQETMELLSLIRISEPTRLRRSSYAVFCLK